MPISILIVFEYQIKQLPGAIIDLYHAYKWSKSYGYETYIFTDIKKTNIELLQSAVLNDDIDDDILTFYKKLENKYIVTNSDDLMFKIKSVLDMEDDKLIIYYSGHGIEDNIIMPNKSLLSFISFRDNILESLSDYVEIFWILDCCNPNGLNLPFKFNNNSFELSSSKIECVTQPILLITSAEKDEKSIATKYGSLFSKSLFKYLNKCNDRNLQVMINKIKEDIDNVGSGYKQTISVYSSYIIHPVLWMWIGNDKTYDIVSDLSLTILILRRGENII